MKAFATITVLVATLLAAAVATPSVAGALPPLGYQLLCLKHPEKCQTGGASRLEATKTVMATLRKVNLHVNSTIRPSAERGGSDVWSENVSAGDCEDYALTKRAKLIALGLPPSALRMAYVKTRRGEDHAVLLIVTSKGNLVLDNLTSAIKPLSQTGLRLISKASANPLQWS